MVALSGPTGAYREVVSAKNPDLEGRISLVRSCDRRAGRRVGVEVQTVAADERDVIRVGGMAVTTRCEYGGRDVQVIEGRPAVTAQERSEGS